MTLHQGARADVDLKATAVRIQEDNLRVGHLRRAGDLAGKVLSCPAGVFMGYDRGELSSAHVADKPARRGVEPADDPGRIDHVAGNVDGLERVLDVTADFPESDTSGTRDQARWIAYLCWLPSAAPGHRRHQPEHERRNDGQESKNEHSSNNASVTPTETDKCARQSQLDDPDAARRDRNRSDDPNKRPRRKSFDERHFGRCNSECPERDDQDCEDTEAAGQRGQREEMPTPGKQVDRSLSKPLEAATVPSNRPPADLPSAQFAKHADTSPTSWASRSLTARARALPRRHRGWQRRRTLRSQASPCSHRRSSRGRRPRSGTRG